MRAKYAILLACSTFLIGGEAWGYAESADPRCATLEPLLKRQCEFSSVANAAEATSRKKAAAANETKAFIADLEANSGSLNAAAKARLEQELAKLRARLLVEQVEADSADARWKALKAKAESAQAAVDLIRSPTSTAAMPSPAPRQTRPSDTTELAFGRSFEEIFRDPDNLLRPSSGEEQATAANSSTQSSPASRRLGIDQSAPLGVSRSSARSISEAVGVFLFDRPIDRRTSGFSFDLSSEDSRLGLQLSFPRAGRYLCLNDGAPAGCTSNGAIQSDRPYLVNFTVGVSAAAKDGFGEIFRGGERSDGGGFADDLKGTVGITKTWFRRRTASDLRQLIQSTERAIGGRGSDLAGECEKDLWTKTPGISREELMAKCSGDKLRDWVLAAKGAGGVSTYAHADSQEALVDAVWGQTHPQFEMGANLDVGYRAFSYRNIASDDPADIELGKPFNRRLHQPTEWEWQASAHLGWFFYHPQTFKPQRVADALDYAVQKPFLYLAALSETGREWEIPSARNDKIICESVQPGSAFTKCSTLDIGAPERDWFWRLGTQAKFGMRLFRVIPQIGFAPKLTFEVTRGELGYDVPISFLQSSDGKLNAGIRIKGEHGTDDSDPFSIGFYLGTTFEILE